MELQPSTSQHTTLKLTVLSSFLPLGSAGSLAHSHISIAAQRAILLPLLKLTVCTAHSWLFWLSLASHNKCSPTYRIATLSNQYQWMWMDFHWLWPFGEVSDITKMYGSGLRRFMQIPASITSKLGRWNHKEKGILWYPDICYSSERMRGKVSKRQSTILSLDFCIWHLGRHWEASPWTAQVQTNFSLEKSNEQFGSFANIFQPSQEANIPPWCSDCLLASKSLTKVPSSHQHVAYTAFPYPHQLSPRPGAIERWDFILPKPAKVPRVASGLNGSIYIKSA